MIELATIDELREVCALYDELNEYLESHINYPCWKKGLYPNHQTARDGIGNRTLYLQRIAGRVAGSVILNHDQPPAYTSVAWGIAAAPLQVITVNTLAVHPDFMGQGVASRLMDFAEELSRSRHIAAIRLDATTGNAPAIRLYQRLGYRYCGDVDLGINLPGLERFFCFEKILSPQYKG